MDKWSMCSHFILRTAGFPFELMKKFKMSKTVACLRKYPDTNITLDEEFHREVLKCFNEDIEETIKKTNTFFRDYPDFKEAIYYCNKSVYRSLDGLDFCKISGLNARVRKRTQSLYLYLQRFCAKNDSIDFYGPITIGKAEEEKKNNIKIKWKTTEERMISSSFFTNRAVNSIINFLISHDEVYIQIVPTINRMALIENNRVAVCQISFQGESSDNIIFERQLTWCELYIIELIKDKKNIKEILEGMITRFNLDERQAREGLKKLQKDDIIKVELQIPKQALDPFHHLKIALDGLIPNGAIIYAKEKIGEMENLKNEYYCTKSLNRKNEIYERLCSVYSEITQKEAWISKGLFYEERFICHRETYKSNDECYLGNNLKGVLDTKVPLVIDLVLSVAYRFYYEYKKLLVEFANLHFRENVIVNIISFVNTLYRDKKFISAVRTLELNTQKWSRELYDMISDKGSIIYDKDTGKITRIVLKENDIRDIIDRFSYCKIDHTYASLDFLLESNSIQDICEDNYRLIIGEVHTNIRVLLMAPVFCNYENKSDLLSDFKSCVQKLSENVIPADSIRKDEGRTIRSGDIVLSDLIFTGFSQKETDKQYIFSEMRVKIGNDAVDLINKDGQIIKLVFVVPNFLESTFLRGFSYPMWFGPAPYLRQNGEQYLPEVSFDNIVISRPTWWISVNELVQVFNKVDALPLKDFMELRKFIDKKGLPYTFYAKFKTEPKIIYFDTENYMGVDVFKRLVFKNKNSDVLITAPVPNEDKIWLTDERGHYCNEFRTLYYC